MQSWTEIVSGTGSNNSFVLHISSLDSSSWYVVVSIWDDSYPIPPGYVLEGGGVSNISPGDTVVLNFISGKMVRDTIKVDPGDPSVIWNYVWVNCWSVGQNYGANPDVNGVTLSMPIPAAIISMFIILAIFPILTRDMW